MNKIYATKQLPNLKDLIGTRSECIDAAIAILREVYPEMPREIFRATWRNWDGSGFTIACTPKNNTVYLSHKWNAARK